MVLAEDAVGTINGDLAAILLDIELFEQVGTGETVSLHELNSEIEVTVLLPDGLINTNPEILRTFYVVRIHEGAIELIECYYDAEENSIKFYTDKFSAYVISCVDVDLTEGETEIDADDDDTDVEIDDGIIEPTEKPAQEADVDAAGENNPHTGAELPSLAVLAISIAAALIFRKRSK